MEPLDGRHGGRPAPRGSDGAVATRGRPPRRRTRRRRTRPSRTTRSRRSHRRWSRPAGRWDTRWAEPGMRGGRGLRRTVSADADRWGLAAVVLLNRRVLELPTAAVHLVELAPLIDAQRAGRNRPGSVTRGSRYSPRRMLSRRAGAPRRSKIPGLRWPHEARHARAKSVPLKSEVLAILRLATSPGSADHSYAAFLGAQVMNERGLQRRQPQGSIVQDRHLDEGRWFLLFPSSPPRGS
jgi:hypothetical protein